MVILIPLLCYLVFFADLDFSPQQRSSSDKKIDDDEGEMGVSIPLEEGDERTIEYTSSLKRIKFTICTSPRPFYPSHPDLNIMPFYPSHPDLNIMQNNALKSWLRTDPEKVLWLTARGKNNGFEQVSQESKKIILVDKVEERGLTIDLMIFFFFNFFRKCSFGR